MSCHDPHQSAAPKLMAKFMHPPFADKQCDVCHAPAKDGKVVLTQPDVKSLCVTCHDDKAKLIDTAKVQHPGAAGDCTDCHSPHASHQPGLPKTNAVDICLGCHSDHRRTGKEATCSINPRSYRAARSAMSRTAATTSICCERRAIRFAWSATDQIQPAESWKPSTCSRFLTEK